MVGFYEMVNFSKLSLTAQIAKPQERSYYRTGKQILLKDEGFQ